MLRVLVVQPTCDKMGHYGIYTIKLCQALGELGHAVTLCTDRAHPERYLDRPPVFEIHQVGGGRWSFEKFEEAAGNRKPRYWWGYYRNSLLIARAALRFCVSRRFDTVFITDVEFMIASLVLWAYARSAPPVVIQVSAANFSFYHYRGSRLKKTYKVLQREIFRTVLGRQIKALSVLGEWHRERLTEQLRLTSSCPAVVTGDGGSEPPVVISRAQARRRLGIDFQGPILLFFGMLRRDKGIETLLEAVQRLPAAPLRLLIAGHPSEYSVDEIRGMLRSFGVENRVIAHLRYVDDKDVPLYFFGSEALVLPYNGRYRDGSGPLMKGACTYGLPVIATDVSEMGRLVRQHRLGLLCAPDSAEALAAKIEQFLALPDAARDELGRRAAALARAHSWEALAGKFSDLFQSIARPAGE
jgi:glycosyltransferase involved in cell wall biosynthesis